MSKILIVEDEEAIADLEKDYLELSGFEVEIASDGEIGLKRALEEDFQLVILDLMLPGVDGFEICREVREKKNIPIIMVSAKKDDIDKIRGLGLGADDYMTKPFSPSELVARVKAHLNRYQRLVNSNIKENTVIEIRGLKIDKTARRVWVDGVEKNFTHSLGHGVGIDIHEQPYYNSQPLREGQVITVEPGLYFDGDFGIRIEDMVKITQDGADNLTKSDKSLIILK